MDTAEYLAEQLELAERRIQEGGPDVAWWRERLTELERRALALRGVVGPEDGGRAARRPPDVE